MSSQWKKCRNSGKKYRWLRKMEKKVEIVKCIHTDSEKIYIVKRIEIVERNRDSGKQYRQLKKIWRQWKKTDNGKKNIVVVRRKDSEKIEIVKNIYREKVEKIYIVEKTDSGKNRHYGKKNLEILEKNTVERKIQRQWEKYIDSEKNDSEE